MLLFRLGQASRCAELLRADGLDVEVEPASATGDVAAWTCQRIPTFHRLAEAVKPSPEWTQFLLLLRLWTDSAIHHILCLKWLPRF